jgi:hypothetical protein
MATLAAAQSARTPNPARYDRIFYSGIAIAMALTVIAGFFPTYYGRAIGAGSGPMHTFGNNPFTFVAHIHGALFSCWVILFVVQTQLVARHKVAIHRTLGIAGGVLAALMVPAGMALAIQSGRRGTAPPGLTSVQFFVIPTFDMVMFAIFVGCALWQRKNKEAHKRLMVLAYTSIVTAAVARLPGVLPHGPAMFYGLTFIFLAVAFAYDLFTRRRLHPAYIWGGAALVLSVPGRMALSGTHAWQSFAGWLLG